MIMALVGVDWMVARINELVQVYALFMVRFGSVMCVCCEINWLGPDGQLESGLRLTALPLAFHPEGEEEGARRNRRCGCIWRVEEVA
jgi:hypothetical protein